MCFLLLCLLVLAFLLSPLRSPIFKPHLPEEHIRISRFSKWHLLIYLSGKDGIAIMLSGKLFFFLIFYGYDSWRQISVYNDRFVLIRKLETNNATVEIKQ